MIFIIIIVLITLGLYCTASEATSVTYNDGQL